MPCKIDGRAKYHEPLCPYTWHDAINILFYNPVIPAHEIGHVSLVECRALFDYLTLPMLHDFHYDEELGSVLAGKWKQQQFISLLCRSSCSLRSLSIGYAHQLHTDELIQILEHTPELVELHLGPTNHVWMAYVMSRSTYQEVPCLVPRLRHLDIYRENAPGFDRDFVDMIESRWRLESPNRTESAIGRIQTVRLRGAQGFDHLHLVRCRGLLAEGLDLQLMMGDNDRSYYDSLLRSVET